MLSQYFTICSRPRTLGTKGNSRLKCSKKRIHSTESSLEILRKGSLAYFIWTVALPITARIIEGVWITRSKRCVYHWNKQAPRGYLIWIGCPTSYNKYYREGVDLLDQIKLLKKIKCISFKSTCPSCVKIFFFFFIKI